jgi:hypothetical protein
MSAADEYPLWPETAIEFRSNPTMLARRFGSCFAEYFVGSIPRVSAQTLALCRIFLGLWVTYFWLAWSGWSPSVLDDLAREGPRRSITKLIESKSQFLTYLSTDPFNRATVYWAIVILLLAFIVGIWTRILYPLLVGLLWVAALLANEDHFLTPLLLGMTATLFVPWSERWSVDRLVNGCRMDTSVAGPYYGYGIWLLGLVIGLTYMTAGLSKLVITDGGWLWDTGVRSGFIRDLYHAPTDWGMTVNNYYLLALGASMLSAFGQGIYVYACFTRSALIKAGMQVLIEENALGWKEFELEVMRDRADNVVIICSIENFDPMGIHTGD